MTLRKRMRNALDKPLPINKDDMGDHSFDPWVDVIYGIDGSYSSESDLIMIGALIAIRDKATFNFFRKVGFAGEFALYVLSGHGLIEYGTSPRYGWPDPEIADMWNELIVKWQNYADVCWGVQEADTDECRGQGWRERDGEHLWQTHTLGKDSRTFCMYCDKERPDD